MIPVHPIHENRIEQIRGRMVCVVTCRGERHIGRVVGCRNGRLVLETEDICREEAVQEEPSHEHKHERKHEQHEEENASNERPRRRRQPNNRNKNRNRNRNTNQQQRRLKRRKHHRHCNCGCRVTARTSAFTPNRFVRRRREIDFDLASIAFLFLLLL